VAVLRGSAKPRRVGTARGPHGISSRRLSLGKSWSPPMTVPAMVSLLAENRHSDLPIDTLAWDLEGHPAERNYGW
jgi:hypothetical protein